MNLFLREVKATRKSLFFWFIGIAFLVAGGMSKYGGMSSSSDSLNELISQMPKSLQAIMGTGTLDLSNPVGYYGVVFTYLVLMGSIHALMLGANIIAKEERDKTAEFLMVKPISRSKIVTAKLAAALVNVVIFNLVTLILSILMVEYYNSGNEPINGVYLLLLGLLIIQLLFLTLGAAIATAGKNPKRAASLGTGLLLLTYILSISIDLNQKLESLKYLTPFKYYEAKHILIDGALDGSFVLLSAVLIIGFISFTYLAFQKRDLHV